MNAQGAPLWAAEGVPICTAPFNQVEPAITTDGAGGAIIAWMDDRDGDVGTNVYFQKVNAAGVVQWAANGIGYLAYGNERWLPLNSPLVSDNAGGVIAWTDYRWVGVPGEDTSWDIYGQRVYCDGSLSQFIALIVPNGGEVWQAGTTHDIRWRCEGINNHDVRIEYSIDGGETYAFVAYVTQVGGLGSYPWLVPNTPSIGCRVKVSLWMPEGMVSDASNGNFTIIGGSGIEDRAAPVLLMLEPLAPNPASGPVTVRLGLPRSKRSTSASTT